MPVNPKQIPVYIHVFKCMMDIDQVQRLVQSGAIEKCSDTHFEHYHFTAAALAQSADGYRNHPLDLTGCSEQLEAVRDSVNDLIERATRKGL